jgi:hypothetical protein
MTGKVRDFVAKVREVSPEIRLYHCLIHHEAIAAKTLPGVHKNVLDEVIKIVNFNKSRIFNLRLFFGFVPGTRF